MQNRLQDILNSFTNKIKEHPKLSIGVATSCLLIYFIRKLQWKIIYLPQIPGVPKSPSKNPSPYKNPRDYGLQNYRDLTIQTQDKTKLRGWYISGSQNPRRVILYFHENAGNIGTRLPYIRQFIERTNSDVIIIAYRGYSDSQGTPSQKGIKEDGDAILKYAIRQAQQKNLPLVVLGRSLGGAVAIHSCSQPYSLNEVKGLILQNTFSSIREVAKSLFGGIFPTPVTNFLLFFLLTNKWQSQKSIGKIVAPTLFIKSMKDQLIPVELMNKLEEKSTSRHQNYIIENGTHNETWDLDPNSYFKRINQFMATL